MKFSTQTIATAALILAIAAPASAMVSPNLKQDVISAAGAGGQVNVLVDGDTVTLTGYVEDAFALQAIEQAASSDGIEVINNVFRSN